MTGAMTLPNGVFCNRQQVVTLVESLICKSITPPKFHMPHKAQQVYPPQLSHTTFLTGFCTSNKPQQPPSLTHQKALNTHNHTMLAMQPLFPLLSHSFSLCMPFLYKLILSHAPCLILFLLYPLLLFQFKYAATLWPFYLFQRILLTSGLSSHLLLQLVTMITSFLSPCLGYCSPSHSLIIRKIIIVIPYTSGLNFNSFSPFHHSCPVSLFSQFH